MQSINENFNPLSGFRESVTDLKEFQKCVSLLTPMRQVIRWHTTAPNDFAGRIIIKNSIFFRPSCLSALSSLFSNNYECTIENEGH